jgi:D-threo-aldose 1-dehydrogenase
MVQSQIPTRFVRETEIDTVLVAGPYTLLDQSAQAELLPACIERNVSVIIGSVYHSGLLANPRLGLETLRSVEPLIVARILQLQRICATYDVPLRAAALQYPARHPAVVSTLVGLRSVAELDDNLAMASYAIPDELWTEVADSEWHD